MRFNLDGVRIEAQAQALFYNLARKFRPVDIGIGGQVSIVIADRAIHFAKDFDSADSFGGALQSRDDVCHFLAKRSWTGGLPMGA
jgi:hypothetical protein